MARPVRPFVKWAGGKRQILDLLGPLLPDSFARYLEPFTGGGALFFHLRNMGVTARGTILNDINIELMNCYRVIQNTDMLPRLCRLLDHHSRRAASLDYYLAVRAWDRDSGFIRKWSPEERAARTIFLNHTCFNGLYRLNSKGQFNVPCGSRGLARRLYDERNLWACHAALQGVDLMEGSFEACLDRARRGDFVYMDPPYDPPSRTASFTAYNGSVFAEADQRRLAEWYRELDRRGCLLMASNSSTPMIRKLYGDYRTASVFANRAINSQPTGRGKIEELVITNYTRARR